MSPGNEGSKLRLASQPDKSQFFHHLNLCYTSHLFKCSVFSPFMPLAQKPLSDTASISGKFQVTGEGSCGAPARELFRKKSPLLLSTTGHFSLDRTETRLQPSPPTKNVSRVPGKLQALFAVAWSFIRVDCGASLDVDP